MSDKIDLEKLEKVSGAGDIISNNYFKCPDCGSKNYSSQSCVVSPYKTVTTCKCNDCGRSWNNTYESSPSNNNNF